MADEILKKTEPSDHFCCCPLPLQGYDVRRQAMQKALTDLAFELARFKIENGTYPHELEDIGQTIRPDPYSDGKEFHYRRLSPNGCLLYSVGPNGVDESGVEDYENKKDDIAIQMP